MTQVIYARVPEQLKEAADAYAAERGATLTSAVVDLLERGLSAVTDERSIAELQATVSQLDAARDKAEGRLHAAVAELGTLRALSERTQQSIGICPNARCLQPITGFDLLATAQCPHCGRRLTDLITLKTAPSIGQQRAGGLNEKDAMLALGAVGAVVALLLLASAAG
jgi:hypothetical protein